MVPKSLDSLIQDHSFPDLIILVNRDLFKIQYADFNGLYRQVGITVLRRLTKKIKVTLQTYQIYVEAFLPILLIYDTCIVHNNVYMSESILSLFERFWKIIKFIKITNGKCQNITKKIFYQKFNSLLAPSSSRALVTSHLFPITLPSP